MLCARTEAPIRGHRRSPSRHKLPLFFPLFPPVFPLLTPGSSRHQKTADRAVQ